MRSSRIDHRAWPGAGHSSVTFRPLDWPTPGLPFRMVWRKSLDDDMQDALRRAFPSGR